MDNQFRRHLGQLIDQHGRGVVENVAECEALLHDLAPRYRAEVNVLTMAVREGVTRTMVSETAKVPWPLLRARMVKRLRDVAIADAAAEWAVDTWAIALGIIVENEAGAHVGPGKTGSPSHDANPDGGATEVQSGAARTPCPYCSELIIVGAVRCRFCHSDLGTAPGQARATVPEKPGVIGLLVLNLLAPGFGSWRCGHPWRGGLIMLLIALATLVWSIELIKPIQDMMQAAMRGNLNIKSTAEIIEEARSGWAYSMMVWLYFYSFIDIWIVYPRDPKPQAGKPR